MIDEYFLENARANWRRGMEKSINEYNRKNPENKFIPDWELDNAEILDL